MSNTLLMHQNPSMCVVLVRFCVCVCVFVCEYVCTCVSVWVCLSVGIECECG